MVLALKAHLTERLLLYRRIGQEQSYFISLFLTCLGGRWQMTSQGLVLLFEVGT
jgi:cyanate permease